MELKLKTCDIQADDCEVVAWAANTTGDHKTDEICELAAYNPLSSFHQYIMPYGDVTSKHWQKHELREFNTRKLRFLINSKKNKVLSTKTEIYALKDFLAWLDTLHKRSSNPIILMCYDEYGYVQEILLQSLHRCNLSNQFLNIVSGFVNCYDICNGIYKDDFECTLSNVSKQLFEQQYSLKRALPIAELCYKIISSINHASEAPANTNDVSNNNFVPLIERYVKNINAKELHSCTKLQISKKKNEINEGRALLDIKKINNNASQGSEINQSVVVSCSNEVAIISWAITTTGFQISDRILNIAAYSSKSEFNEFITPKKFISSSYRQNLRVIKSNGTMYLQDLRIQKFLDTKPEIDVLKEFILWLEQLKESKHKDIILLYHEQYKHSVPILLKALRRHSFIKIFSDVVKGFINMYDIMQDKCGDMTTSFTLTNMCQVLLKKKTKIGDSMIKAKTCCEILTALGKLQKAETLNSVCVFKDGSCFHKFIEPYITTVSNEEYELAQRKGGTRVKNSSKPKKVTFLESNASTSANTV